MMTTQAQREAVNKNKQSSFIRTDVFPHSSICLLMELCILLQTKNLCWEKFCLSPAQSTANPVVSSTSPTFIARESGINSGKFEGLSGKTCPWVVPRVSKLISQGTPVGKFFQKTLTFGLNCEDNAGQSNPRVTSEHILVLPRYNSVQMFEPFLAHCYSVILSLKNI